MRTADVKDQIELSGNDIQAVSMTGEELLSVDTCLPVNNVGNRMSCDGQSVRSSCNVLWTSFTAASRMRLKLQAARSVCAALS